MVDKAEIEYVGQNPAILPVEMRSPRILLFLGYVSTLAVFFFFQAEDGIRDVAVTGVQTCALPISSPRAGAARGEAGGDLQRLVCRGSAEIRARRQYARPVQERRGGQPARRGARVPRPAQGRDPRRLVGHRLSVERDQHARAHEVPRRLSEPLEGLPPPR